VYRVASNVRHNISVEYEFRDKYSLREGVKNLANELPSYPTVGNIFGAPYGDVSGREFFVGIDARF